MINRPHNEGCRAPRPGRVRYEVWRGSVQRPVRDAMELDEEVLNLVRRGVPLREIEIHVAGVKR